ncbi:MAG: SCP2 sterol-binding domain-containing protein [Caulobacterales bacterium]|jgi:predicted lipid carrier protein YhbT|nr:SCP2 sterol-binding domain-containing protein [Caulobacterales bacterium]
MRHIVRRVAASHPDMFARLGAHRTSRYVIKPTDLPLSLYLQPNPANPVLRLLSTSVRPAHDAHIAAPFAVLMRMIEADADGDALFFSRDLEISGDTEAIVSLRNAIDSLDRPLTDIVADVLGPAGRVGLVLVRTYAHGRSA